MEKERLVTPSFCAILAANFLLYFGFWLLTPILPFYLSEVFHTSHTAIGVILSCYTISSLCIRPFSGYILDTFARKPLYLLAYFIFWEVYFRRPSLPAALWLAILPSAIFILRGVIFRHWLLTAFGVMFAVGHIYITWYNNRSEGTGNE